jgi:hypothetical protein
MVKSGPEPSANDGFDDHANARRVFAALSAGFMPPVRTGCWIGWMFTRIG